MIKLVSSVTSSVGSGYSHSPTIGRGNNRLFIVIISEWKVSTTITGVTLNGVSGKLVFENTASAALLKAYYWNDSQLPANGNSWTISSIGNTFTDTAITGFLLTGVDQNLPFSNQRAIYVPNTHPTIAGFTQNGGIVASSVLVSNTATPDFPLLNSLSVSNGNTKLLAAFSPIFISQPGFTTTGDARTSIGVIPLNEYRDDQFLFLFSNLKYSYAQLDGMGQRGMLI